MSQEIETNPGQPENGGEQRVDPEIFARDLSLTQRIKAGYTPHIDENGEEGRIIDGHLDEDAAEALSELWQVYRRATVKMAHRRAGSLDEISAINVQDLANESYFGIYHAAITWNPDRGRSFQLFATIMVNNYMNWYVDDHSTTVRTPRYIRQAIRRVDDTYWGLYRQGKGRPTEEVVAKKAGITVEKLRELKRAKRLTREMASLDTGGGEIGSIHSPTSKPLIEWMKWEPIDLTAEQSPSVIHNLVVEDLELLARRIISGDRFPRLDERDREILKLRHMGDAGERSQREVGELIGISHQAVNQRERKAVKNLRNLIKMSDYLDVDD